MVALDLPGYAYHGDGSLDPPARGIEVSVTELAGVEEAARSVEAIIHLAVAVEPNDYLGFSRITSAHTQLLGLRILLAADGSMKVEFGM